MPSVALVITFLLALCFTLATQIGLWQQQSAPPAASSAAGVLETLMGDSRRLFAIHFFTKADVYLHSGVYPSIFDQAQRARKTHLAEATGDSGEAAENAHGEEHGDAADHDHEHEHENDAVSGLFSQPKDWIDAFGREFIPTRHTHLESVRQREMLPWLRLAAELNPNQVETYTVGAYWLRSRMGRVKEAEQFLREGWRANPDSPEILFELGRMYEENYGDPARAQNLYTLTLKKWQVSEAAKPHPDKFTSIEVTMRLARLHQRQGRIDEAVRYLQMLKTLSPRPEAIQKQIDELTAQPVQHG